MAGRGHNTAYGYDVGPPPPNYSGAVMPQYPAPAYFPPQSSHFNAYMGAWPQHQYNGIGHPCPAPLTDGTFPGINLRNHFGGVGLPPGYNYIFPSDHTIVHILTVPTKPWLLPASPFPSSHTPLPHTKFYVPVSMNLKEFLGKVGCVDADDSKNVVYEIVEKGNGGWARGLRIGMDNKDKMNKSLGDLGWRRNRNGNLARGGQPVVWLWREVDAPLP